MPSWTANVTSRETVAGPAGTTYGDIPSRIIAFVIDYVILSVVFFIVGTLSNSIFGINTGLGFTFPTTTSLLIAAILDLVIAAAYFIYTWTNPQMRASVGMRVAGLQVGNETDGGPISVNQAGVRYAVLFGPYVAASLLAAFALQLSLLMTLLGIVWFIVLLATAAQSPTLQGLHDRYARTVVVRGGNRMF